MNRFFEFGWNKFVLLSRNFFLDILLSLPFLFVIPLVFFICFILCSFLLSYFIFQCMFYCFFYHFVSFFFFSFVFFIFVLLFAFFYLVLIFVFFLVWNLLKQKFLRLPNNFYFSNCRNYAVLRDSRSTIVAGTAGQHYVDNIFYNPNNDYEMITVNKSR